MQENFAEHTLFSKTATLIEQTRGAVVFQANYALNPVVLEDRQKGERDGSAK